MKATYPEAKASARRVSAKRRVSDKVRMPRLGKGKRALLAEKAEPAGEAGAGLLKERGLGLMADHALALKPMVKRELGIEVDTGGVTTALSAFMRDAGEVPLLTVEEEVNLAARIRKGDMASRDRMIRANLRLVIKIARDYEHLGLPLLDLISEGCIGLMKAVDRFDPAKGGKMSTYGAWWIKQQMRRALANQGRTIRLPVHVEAKIYRLGRAELKLQELLGREATDEELADEMGMKAKRVSRLRRSAVRPGSLDAPVGEDGESSLGELVGDSAAMDPYQAFEMKSDQSLVMRLLERLSGRELEILKCRFGLDGRPEQTLEELGEKFGLTRERIRQLQNEAFKKLRALMEAS